MTTIIIKNVPENIVKIYWTNISYEKIKNDFLPKKLNTNRLKWLSNEEIEKKFYNKEDESYWPFIWEENSTFLKSLMK